MIKQIKKRIFTTVITALIILSGCDTSSIPSGGTTNISTDINNYGSENLSFISPTKQVTKLTDGLSTVAYDGDYGFDDFLTNGGAVSDAGVVEFMSSNLLEELGGISLAGNGFGCSTISTKDEQGNAIFGRNFDWQESNALVVRTTPESGFASVSTVNLDFMSGYSDILSQLSDDAKTIASVYSPLDGMNEKGFCAAVLMISDPVIIDQNTEKPDLTTTTAIRLLLDKAADVPQAITLLEQYDMHSSMDIMVHFALSDATGRSVVVEYVDNKIIVTETPVVTNFYIAEGDKNGVGSSQSHERYELLTQQLEKTQTMNMDAVRDAMDSVSKDNFGEFESTEWSIIYNQSKGEVRYYHRENYKQGFVFHLK